MLCAMPDKPAAMLLYLNFRKLRALYEDYRLWTLCKFVPAPAGIAQQQPRQATARRSQRAPSGAPAAAAAATTPDGAAEQDTAGNYAQFSEEFGVAEYLAAALLKHFQLVPSTTPYTTSLWPLAVLESAGMVETPYDRVEELLKVGLS